MRLQKLESLAQFCHGEESMVSRFNVTNEVQMSCLLRARLALSKTWVSRRSSEASRTGRESQCWADTDAIKLGRLAGALEVVRVSAISVESPLR